MYGGRGAYTPLRQTDNNGEMHLTSTNGTFSMFMEYTTKPQGRKIQNLVYGIVDAVMLGVAIAYVDTSAAFQIYYSGTYDPSKAFSLQIEWMTVMFVALQLIVNWWKALNIGDAYEKCVQQGFVVVNWVNFALTGALILCQLFVMEGNLLIGFLLTYGFLWIAISIALGFQEHQNEAYVGVQAAVERNVKGIEGNAGSMIRNQRLIYFALTCIPLFAAMAILGSQAAYDTIKGATDLPNGFKAYIAVTFFFVIAISGNTAMSIYNSGTAGSHEDAVKQNMKQEGMTTFWIWAWTIASVVFVYVIMKENNNLGFILSTPLQTIN